MNIYRRVIWPTPEWKVSQRFTAHTPQHGRLFWSCNNPRNMETHLESNPVFPYSWWFWNWICGGKHAHHLHQVLQEYYEISEDWKGEKFAGIELEWNYSPCTKTSPAASQYKDTLNQSLSDLATSARLNFRSLPTSIMKVTMESKYKWPQRKWLA